MTNLDKREKRKGIVETLGYLVGTVMVSILGFVVSLLYSKFYSPADYGVYSLVFSGYSLISAIYGGWLSLSLIRNVEGYRKQGKESEFWGTIYITHFVMWVVLFLTCTIVVKVLDVELIYHQLIVILSIVYYSEYFLQITNTRFRTLGMSTAYSFNTSLNNFLKIIIILLLYYVIHFQSILGIAISLLAAEMIQTIVLTFKYKLYTFFKWHLFRKKIIKYLFFYGFPLMGISITTWILNVSDRYIIQFYWSETEVGLYSYAYSLGNSLFSLLIQFIMLGAYPQIVKAWEYKGKQKAEDMLQQYLKIYFYVLVPACAGVIGVAKNMFMALTNIRYHSAYMVFIVTCLSIAVLGLTQYTNKAWELTGNTKVILNFNIMAGCINLVLNFICVPKFGYQIAAWTTFISYVVYLIVAFILSKKYLKIKIDIISLSRVVLSASIMFAGIYGINLLNISIVIKLVVQIVAGIFLYASAMILTQEIRISEIRNTLRKK